MSFDVLKDAVESFGDDPAMGFNRRKIEDQRRDAAVKEAAARSTTDAQVLGFPPGTSVSPSGCPCLFSPTIGAAITAGYSASTKGAAIGRVALGRHGRQRRIEARRQDQSAAFLLIGREPLPPAGSVGGLF